MCFAAEILRRGWRISRPYGDSAPYDCIVDATPRRATARCLPPPASRPLLWRVQVKSVSVPDRDGRSNHHAGSSRRLSNHQSRTTNHPSRFHLCIAKGSRSKKRYSGRDIDFIAVLIVPHGTWYIIPVRALRRQVSISLWGNRAGRLEKYREAWDLLADRRPASQSL